MREFNVVHHFTPVPVEPSRMGAVRQCGGNLVHELGISSDPAVPPGFRQPVYSTPAKNRRAMEAAAAELPGLTGDDLLRQQRRLQDLLIAANRQQTSQSRPAASKTPSLAGGAPQPGAPNPNQPTAGATHAGKQASSPNPH